MTMYRIALLALTAAALVACQKPAADRDAAPATPAPGSATPPSASNPMPGSAVRIALDRTSYRSRDDVKLTITNESQRQLGYNACTRTVERESAGGWTAVPEPDRVCTMELRLLEGGATVNEQTDLPAVAAGRYRLTIQFSDESAANGAPVLGVSQPFTVQ